MRKEIKTGIPGLDEMLGGGLPEGSVTVISGPPGIGKSNLAMQYIYNGIMQYDEPGVYITIEEGIEDIEEYAGKFGWNLRACENNGKLAILGREIFEGTDMDLGILKDIINKINAKRVVLDSLTLFNYLFKEETARRLHILRFLEIMKKSRCTTIMTAEQQGNLLDIQYHAEHFLSDGLMMLFWSRYKANNERCVWVVKIRGNKINSDIRPVKITNEGVVVYPKEVPFTLVKDGGTGFS